MNLNLIRLVILEDEPLAAERLIRQLKKSPVSVQVLEVLESVSQATKWFSANESPDLVLSDIQLGDGISFQIFEKQLVSCPIIFTTSYDEFAVRAFKVQSLDYLLKPIKQEELDSALLRFVEKRQLAQLPWMQMQEKIGQMMQQIGVSQTSFKERFIVRHADQLIPVSVSEVAYFFTKNDWVCLTTVSGKQYLVDGNLEELEKMVDPGRFFRLNRQFLAQSESIEKAFNHLNGKLKLELKPNPEVEIFVSREKASVFKSWWETGRV
jgi:DNA-binding LytR/AlgR family response regulator